MIRLSVYAPDRALVVNQEVPFAKLTTSEGEIEILPDHIKMVGVLRPGMFEFEHPEKGVVRGFISNGYFEVADGELMVLAETLEKDSEIDLERAAKAQKKAEAGMVLGEWTEGNFSKISRKYERALARQSVAQGYVKQSGLKQ